MPFFHERVVILKREVILERCRLVAAAEFEWFVAAAGPVVGRRPPQRERPEPGSEPFE
jgi:hypothetical protein